MKLLTSIILTNFEKLSVTLFKDPAATIWSWKGLHEAVFDPENCSEADYDTLSYTGENQPMRSKDESRPMAE